MSSITATSTIDNTHRLYLGGSPSALSQSRLHLTQRQKPVTQVPPTAGTSICEFAPPSTPRVKQSTGPFGNLRNRNSRESRSGSVTLRSGSTSSSDAEHSISASRTPPLPRFHSRQCVPSNHRELLSQCTLGDLRSSSTADRHLPTYNSTSRSRSPSSNMALKLLGGRGESGSSSGVKHFDIRLDNDFIVFRGSEDESASAQLAGSLVLCLTEPLNISHIQLTLSGIVHMCYQSASSSSISGKKMSYKEKTFFERTWPFKVSGKSKTETLPPDNYEWPFDCILEGNLPESVEGLKDAWIIYRLKAEIGRRRAKDIIIRKPLRIVRTLDSSALELAHAMSVENIWPNKIEYSINIPSKAVAFGSYIQVDFKLIPLLKGLVIGHIATSFREEQEFVVDPEWGVSAMAGGLTKTERVICSDSYDVEKEVGMEVIEEAVEGYQFSRYLELPKTLNQCLQDCNVKGIKVRHKVKFTVQLVNPDGHVSELRANLPVSLYISPSLPIDENNDLVDQSPQALRAAMHNDLANSAPPLYGNHILDKLYSEVDPSGYLTPGFGLSAPGTPYLHSRQQSHENLRNFTAHADGTVDSLPSNGALPLNPAALEHRLQNLHVTGEPSPSNQELDVQVHPASDEHSRRNSDQHVRPDYFSAHGSPQAHISADQGQGSSMAMSRQGSQEGDGSQSGARTPFPQFAHMEDLNRVPSYTTAVRTAAPRKISQGAETDLPTYGESVTAPTAAAISEPPTAHIRSQPGSRNASIAEQGQSGNSTPAAHRHVSALQDDDRRLRLMQMRAR